MKPRQLLTVSLLAFASLASAEDDVSKSLGLNEFRHVKPGLVSMTCGPSAWESGNYFDNGIPNQNRLFTPDADTVTVKLKAAYFSDAPERSKYWFFLNKYKVQIGIFADISAKGGNLGAPGAGGIPGRLVFFSDDYFLSQRRIADVNTNIYGPVMYTGGGLAIKLTMLEFDRSKEDRLKDTLMKSVAELGSKASAGVPSYLEGPLTALFQTALSAAKSKDDVFGQIMFVLDDRNGVDNPPTSPLRTGDIVIARHYYRKDAIEWDKLCYNPSTAEVFVEVVGKQPEEKQAAAAPKPEVRYEPPALNYVAISLLKNAGADAGKVQDALTYERLVADFQQRKSDAGLISSIAAVTTALNERATDRELNRLVDILARNDGSVSPLEKSDAAIHLSKVLYASQLGFHGFDVTTITHADDCEYLKDERLKADWLTRLFVRLGIANNKYTRDNIDQRSRPIPKTCVEATTQLNNVYKFLLNPT